MVDEFKLPMEIIDRKVTKMKMISPSNKEVDVGKTLSDTEWIGMCRREVFDDYLRNRAQKNGAKVSNTHPVQEVVVEFMRYFALRCCTSLICCCRSPMV